MEKRFMKGNEAVAEAAVRAGGGFFSRRERVCGVFRAAGFPLSNR